MKALLRLVFEVNCDAIEPHKINVFCKSLWRVKVDKMSSRRKNCQENANVSF